MREPAPRMDPGEIARFAQMQFDNGAEVVEVRIPKASTPQWKKEHGESGYFNNSKAIVDALRNIKAPGIYITVNPVMPDLIARGVNRLRPVEKGMTTSDTQIVRRIFLYIDVDAKRPAGISATDAEKSAAIERAKAIAAKLKGRGWPDGIFIDSGNGGNLLYLVDLPADDGGLVERVVKEISRQFSDDAVTIDPVVFNPSRIIKLPGTMACKGDCTADRPHRLSRIVSVPGKLELVTREQLEELAAMAPPAPAAAPRVRVNGRAGGVSNFERCSRYVEKCPPSVEGAKGSNAILRVACEGYRFGLEDAEVVTLCTQWSEAHAVPPWSEEEIRHKVESAKKKVTASGEFGVRIADQRNGNGAHHVGRWDSNCARARGGESVQGQDGDGAAVATLEAEQPADTTARPRPTNLDPDEWDPPQPDDEDFQGTTDPEYVADEAAADEAEPTPTLVCMADVQPREISWLWPGRIPLGRISLLVGRPGEGKSFLTSDMAARVSTGTPWPDGTPCPLGPVVMISAEDDAGDTIRPRLDAAHAAVGKVFLLTGLEWRGKDGKKREVVFTLQNVAALERVFKQVRPALCIIDPIGSVLGGKVDSHRDNETRGVLAPVAQLAERYGVAVLIVAHRRKSSGANADEMTLGSRAFTGIARAVWHLSRDPENKERRLLLPGKNNLAKEGHGLAFTIDGTPPSLWWESDPVTMNADDGLAAENGGDEERRRGPEPKAREAAEEWLERLLAKGSMPVGDPKKPEEGTIRAEAAAAAMSWRTVRRAAEELGVQSHKCPYTKRYLWHLVQRGQPTPNVNNVDNLDNQQKQREKQ